MRIVSLREFFQPISNNVFGYNPSLTNPEISLHIHRVNYE